MNYAETANDGIGLTFSSACEGRAGEGEAITQPSAYAEKANVGVGMSFSPPFEGGAGGVNHFGICPPPSTARSQLSLSSDRIPSTLLTPPARPSNGGEKNRRSLFLVIAASLIATQAASAAPSDELLRLVPDDMSFCAVLRNGRDRAQSDNLRALMNMPLVRVRLESPEIKKLREFQQTMLKELEITPAQLRDDLLGDAAVFAYRAGPADQPGKEQAMFQVWARDQALLARVVNRLNQMQIKSGELKEVRAAEYKGQSYVQRVKGDAHGDGGCYFIRDNLIVFATRNALLQSAIDQGRQAPDPRQAPYWARMLDDLGLRKTTFAALVNPRSFDGALKALETAALGADRGVLAEFQRYWRAIDGVGLYADAANDLEIGVAVQARTDDLPKTARQFFGELGKPSALWQAIPDDALFALAARTDFAALGEVFSGFCDEAKRQEIQRAFRGGVQPFLADESNIGGQIKGLGPDWGAWAVRPNAKDKTWVPQAMLAVKLQPTAEGAAVEKTVQNAVQFLTTIAQFKFADVLRVETILDGKVKIRHVVHETAFPSGFRPAFAVKDNYLLFASSPEMIQRFKGPVDGSAAAEAPLLRISASGWRQYLAEHKNEIALFLAKSMGTSADELQHDIAEWLPNLKSLDRLELVVRSRPNAATLTLRLKMAKE
jgi:hypothetical protein